MRTALRASRQPFLRSPNITHHHRAFSTTLQTLSSPFASQPSPPRLPKEEQEIFEELQRRSTGAFSTPRAADNQSAGGNSEEEARSADARASAPAPASTSSPASRINQINQSPEGGSDEIREGEGEEVHPNMRRGAPPEFEGEVNPKTGEVGGPKNEPLRWGSAGDWSFNGRVTDF